MTDDEKKKHNDRMRAYRATPEGLRASREAARKWLVKKTGKAVKPQKGKE